MRAVYFVIGWVCVGLGVVGMTLPLLPTVPFLLLAAACFARSSDTARDWLLGHPVLGPPIHDWRRHGAIRRPVKRLAVVSMLASFGVTLALGAALWVVVVQVVALGCAAAFILSRPDGPAPD